MTAPCPACGTAAGAPFYFVSDVPVHQVKLVPTRAKALNCARGDIRLHACPGCGFIWNAAFDPALMSYGADYESTQAVSPTFNAFHEHLARDLIERFDLQGKVVVELGCGQGEFIDMLAQLGPNEGYGFDDVVRQEGPRGAALLIKGRFDEHSRLDPDFVVCKMTLEHVHDVGDFLRGLRRAIGDRPGCTVVFMIPEVTRILKLRAFWDIYYEHCSYWSAHSLCRAFSLAGFNPIDAWTDYADQYVLIATRPGTGAAWRAGPEPDAMMRLAEEFGHEAKASITGWQQWLWPLENDAARPRLALWGGGSKAVAFLNTLDVTRAIPYAVDVNPRRDGTFIAGTGQQIVAPEFLRDYRPDTIIVMSPIYLPEILAKLAELGLTAKVVSVETGVPY